MFRAFNNIRAQHLLELGKSAGSPGRIALPVAGDDPDTKRTVMELGSTRSTPARSTSPGANSQAPPSTRPTSTQQA